MNRVWDWTVLAPKSGLFEWTEEQTTLKLNTDAVYRIHAQTGVEGGQSNGGAWIEVNGSYVVVADSECDKNGSVSMEITQALKKGDRVRVGVLGGHNDSDYNVLTVEKRV